MPSVPFCRPLEKGAKGKDVVGHKRALSRAAPDLYPWLGNKFTPVFGARFETAVIKYQRRIKRPATGRIGKGTHEALENAKAKNKPGEWAFDSLAIKYCTEYCSDYIKNPREKIVSAAFYWYSKRTFIIYSQYRPMALGKPPWYPNKWDCSGFVTACYYAGGAKDPNGRGYDGLGYTGTLMSQGRRIDRDQLKIGDLIFYGFNKWGKPGFPVGSPTHVALYVGEGKVLSMGNYPMGYYPYNYRGDINHYRTYTL